MAGSERTRLFQDAFRSVTEASARALCLPSLTGSAGAFAAAALAEKVGCVLAVTPGLPEADALVADLRVLDGETAVRAHGGLAIQHPKVRHQRIRLGKARRDGKHAPHLLRERRRRKRPCGSRQGR